MIRLRDLSDDHYEFNEEHYAVVGRKTNKMYQLGAEVYVKVKNADLVKRHLDFIMLGTKAEIETYD